MLRIDSVSISASERLTEIAEILALGLMRLHARKSSAISARRRRFAGLCCPPERSFNRTQQ
jgi:hypothetical protein